jgi:tRNA nucleotidyltransferase (CCA-adding enzyme)
MYFLTARLQSKDVSDLQRLMPRKDLVEAWRDIEDHAKDLAKRLSGKEAATPSRTWQLLSDARPEMVLFLAVTAKQQAVAQKIRNFFTKWRQVQQKIPLPEMTELLITPQLREYPKIARDVFMLLLDGKLRSRTETLKFLKPFAPPPPPPPPPPRRGRAAKAAAAGANGPTSGTSGTAATGKKGDVQVKGKGKGATAPAVALASSSAKPEAKKREAEKPSKAAPEPRKSASKSGGKAVKKKAPKKAKKRK